jgi:hypothetical protein
VLCRMSVWCPPAFGSAPQHMLKPSPLHG